MQLAKLVLFISVFSFVSGSLYSNETLKTQEGETTRVNDRQIKATLYRRGNQLLNASDVVTGEKIREQLAACPESIALQIPAIQNDDAESVFKRSYRSTLIVGNLYDCGRCNNKHLGSGGGVVLTADGLVLTNYHVIDNEQTLNFMAMTCDGKVFPVVEVVAANKVADLAIIRIDAQGLTPAPLATAEPDPLTDLFVISHPHQRYFLTTEGILSRYSSGKGSRKSRPNWMEITAVFSQGSSGCGVFNRDGELIGLVSRKETVFSRDDDGKPEQTMIIKKCVPLAAIFKMLQM